MGGTGCSFSSGPQGDTGRAWETVEHHSNQLRDTIYSLIYSAVLSSRFPMMAVPIIKLAIYTSKIERDPGQAP